MSKKLYYLKQDALVSAERRRDKLAFKLEVEYFFILEEQGVEVADKLEEGWLKEQQMIDEALLHVVGTAYSPKAEGKYWKVINDCIGKVSIL